MQPLPQLKPEKRRLTDQKFRGNKRAYFLQALAATLYIFLTYLVLGRFGDGWASAPLAASTFIAFSFPQTNSARPRYLIGGYCVATVTGSLLCGLARLLERAGVPESRVIGCTLAVLSTMLLMTLLDFEHPPAMAVSVILVSAEAPLVVGLVAVACIVLLCLIKRALTPVLRNL